jgi:hypothetical protein
MLNEQLSLIDESAGEAEQQPTSDAAIKAQKSMLGALLLSWQVSGLEDKKIYRTMQIDKSTWSKIWSGGAYMPTNGYVQFMQITKNIIPLQWLAFQFGKGLYDLEDAKDKEIRELKQKVVEQANEINTLVKYGVIQRAK